MGYLSRKPTTTTTTESTHLIENFDANATWDSENGKEVMRKMLEQLTPHEVAVMMNLKQKDKGKTGVGTYDWVAKKAKGKLKWA